MIIVFMNLWTDRTISESVVCTVVYWEYSTAKVEKIVDTELLSFVFVINKFGLRVE